MKIMICGSMSFIKDIVKVKKVLDRIGHNASIPHGTKPHQKDKSYVDKLEANMKYCRV
jgi:hypothetical protein